MQRDQATRALSVILRLRRVACEREIDDLERFAEVAVLGSDHREQEQRGGALGIRGENLEQSSCASLNSRRSNASSASRCSTERSGAVPLAVMPPNHSRRLLAERVGELQADLAGPEQLFG